MSEQNLKIVFSAVDQMTATLQKIDANQQALFRRMQGQTKHLEAATRSVGTGWQDVTKGIIGAELALGALRAASATLWSGFKAGLLAIDDLRMGSASLAATIVSMQDSARPLADRFKEAKVYAQAVYERMEILDKKTILTAKNLQDMTDQLAQGGVLIDLMNTEHDKFIVSLGNAIALKTKGQNLDVQMRQEVRGLLSGEIKSTNLLAQALNQQVGGNLSRLIPQWQEQGTLIQNLTRLLEGYGVAAADLENTLTAQETTLRSITTRVLRGGLQPAYDEIVASAKELADLFVDENGHLTKQGEIISKDIALAWDVVAAHMQPVLWLAEKMMVPFNYLSERAQEMKKAIPNLPGASWLPGMSYFAGGAVHRGGATRSWEVATAPVISPPKKDETDALKKAADEHRRLEEQWARDDAQWQRELNEIQMSGAEFRTLVAKTEYETGVAFAKKMGKDTTQLTALYEARKTKIIADEAKSRLDALQKAADEMVAEMREETWEMREGERIREEQQRLAEDSARAWSDSFHDFFVGFATESERMGDVWRNLIRSLKYTFFEQLLKPLSDWVGGAMSVASNSLWSSLGMGGGGGGGGSMAMVQTGPSTWTMQPQGAGGTAQQMGMSFASMGLSSFAGASVFGGGAAASPGIIGSTSLFGGGAAASPGIIGSSAAGLSAGTWAGAAGSAYLGYSLGSMAGQAAFDKKSHGTQELGAAGGAAAGAVIGTMIAPGIGTIIGAGIGALVGAFGGSAFGHSIQKAEAHKTIKWAKETVADLDRVLTRHGYALGNRPPTLSNYGPVDKYGSPYSRWPEMATAPGRLSAFGQDLSLLYKGSHPELEEADQQKLQEWAQSIAQMAEQLAQTSAQIVGGSLADAFVQPDATSAVQAWSQTLKMGVFQAVDGGVAAALMNTAVIQSRMGPLMQRIGTVFGPEAVWGPDMEKGIQAIIRDTKKMAESPEVQALIKTLYEVRQTWGTDLGLWASPASISHVPALAMAGGGVITEPVFGVGRSGRRYTFGEEGPETVTPGAGGGVTVNVNFAGAVIADEMGMKKLARIIHQEIKRIDSRVF